VNGRATLRDAPRRCAPRRSRGLRSLPPVTRWKLTSAVLAAIAGYALFVRGPSAVDIPSAPAPAVREARGAIPTALRRPIRISAAAAGFSSDELVARMRSARSVQDVVMLAEKLAIVGDDAAIREVMPLLGDPRRGVPEAVLGAIGRIATEYAVEVLIRCSTDDRPPVRNAAIAALGTTQSAEAERVLLALARRPGSPARVLAVHALGRLASDDAVELLTELASAPEHRLATAAITALGAVASPTARAALVALLDAPDTRIAAAALAAIDEIDPALAGRLAKLAQTGDLYLASAAVAALGKVGEVGLPALREAALTGHTNTRWAAVHAIGQVEGDRATALLGEILGTGDRQAATAAASVLVARGGSRARELLIQAALSERGHFTNAVAQLAQLEGEDVEAALVEVMRKGSSAERRQALPRLLGSGNPDAMKLALDMATRGSRTERADAMRLLAESGAPEAWDTLIDIAGRSRGTTRVSALEMLASHRPGDPSIEALLSDSLFSGRRDEAAYAAGVLGRLSTEQSRHTLVAALTGTDKAVAVAAAQALAGAAVTGEVKTALLAAAREHKSLRMQVANQLIHAGAPEGLTLAAEMLDRKEDAAQASSVLWTLTSHGGPEARRLIERALGSSEPGVRVAAVATLAQNPDDRATDTLLGMTRDGDARVRATALQTLGQVGSERAQLAILDATRSGSVDDRVAAIGGLSGSDDVRAAQQLASLMRDPEPRIALQAIQSSYNAGPEVDRVLVQIVNDPQAKVELRHSAAHQLRNRGSELDDVTEQRISEISGPAYGGHGYGGVRYVDYEM
jgi:HEAT repeat protein